MKQRIYWAKVVGSTSDLQNSYTANRETCSYP